MNSEMPIVILVGSPYERGLAHGSRYRSEIRRILDRDLGKFTEQKLTEARRAANVAFQEVLAHAPEIAEEIKGIAVGSGHSVNDIVLRGGPELFKRYEDTGCSALAFKTATGAIAGQNWDGSPDKDGDLALFLHFSNSAFKYAVITSYGGLCNVGMNCHGLALVNNDILLKDSRDGLTSQVVRRLVMEMPDIRSARDLLAPLKYIGGKSHLLADRTGEVANVEISAKSGVHFLPASDAYVHANTALLPITDAEQNLASLAKHYPSSRWRQQSLEASLARGPRSVEGAMKILRNEDGAPNSVCKTASPDEPTQTAFSIIFDSAQRVIHLAAGRPSKNAYRKIALPI